MRFPPRAGGYSVMMWLIVKVLNTRTGGFNLGPLMRAADRAPQARKCCGRPAILTSLKAAAKSRLTGVTAGGPTYTPRR